jgi:hypothetical protein
MSAVAFLSRPEWEASLKAFGCKPLEGKGGLNTAEWWQLPWDSYPFTVPIEADTVPIEADTVPIEADGRCAKRALNLLLQSIISQAPPGFEFPPED